MEERSAGAIVFHDGQGGRLFLLLKYPAGHWDFPKGNIEEGESLNDTVTREIFEETGLSNVSRVGDFAKTIEYFYRRGGGKVHKTVTFFLVKAHDDHVRLSHEHQDFGWFGLNEAIKTVTYPNSKTVLSESARFLESASRESGKKPGIS